MWSVLLVFHCVQDCTMAPTALLSGCCLSTALSAVRGSMTAHSLFKEGGSTLGPRSSVPMHRTHAHHYAPWLLGWKIPSGYPDMIVKLLHPSLNYTKRRADTVHRYFNRVEGLEWKCLSWSTFTFRIAISQGSGEKRIHFNEENFLKEWITGSGDSKSIGYREISNSGKLIAPSGLKGNR